MLRVIFFLLAALTMAAVPRLVGEVRYQYHLWQQPIHYYLPGFGPEYYQTNN